MGVIDSGAFIPTTSLFDVSDIYSTEVTSKEFKDLIIRLYENQKQVNLLLNMKETAIYTREEFVCGQTYFPNTSLSSSTAVTPTQRQVYRKVINVTSVLPNTGTLQIPHGLTTTEVMSVTNIYGASTIPAAVAANRRYITLPYPSADGTTNIELYADNTNINIITASDRTDYTITYVVVEFLKQ